MYRVKWAMLRRGAGRPGRWPPRRPKGADRLHQPAVVQPAGADRRPRPGRAAGAEVLRQGAFRAAGPTSGSAWKRPPRPRPSSATARRRTANTGSTSLRSTGPAGSTRPTSTRPRRAWSWSSTRGPRRSTCSGCRSSSGEMFLQCQVRDANPDYGTVKLEYRGIDHAWHGMEPVADAPGVFRMPDQVGSPRRRPRHRRRQGRQPDRPRSGHDPRRSRRAVTTAAPSRSPRRRRRPMPPVDAAHAADAAAGPRRRPRRRCRPGWPRSRRRRRPMRRPRTSRSCSMASTACSNTPSTCPTPPRSKATRPRTAARPGSRLGEDAEHKSPFEFELPGDGTYGLMLVVSTPNHPAQPPAAGDAPDWWVEIDTGKPTVQMTDVSSAPATRPARSSSSGPPRTRTSGRTRCRSTGPRRRAARGHSGPPA